MSFPLVFCVSMLYESSVVPPTAFKMSVSPFRVSDVKNESGCGSFAVLLTNIFLRELGNIFVK